MRSSGWSEDRWWLLHHDVFCVEHVLCFPVSPMRDSSCGDSAFDASANEELMKYEYSLNFQGLAAVGAGNNTKQYVVVGLHASVETSQCTCGGRKGF